ncbi:hypothetical protein LTR94_023998, partial [Friedmanniomyces endolithicus]
FSGDCMISQYARLGALLATTALSTLTLDIRHASALMQVESGRPASQADEIEDVIVTGTNIRGRAPIGRVVSIEREEFERGGFLDAGQALRTLPQNFAGGVNVEGRRTFESGGSSTGPGQSGANLFGLGSGSTLVLMNGNRLPLYSSGVTSDIGLIPAVAIERIEVLSNGASAVYGADAVAGVVNVITRKDYDGIEARVSYGSAAAGLETTSGSLLIGGSFLGGNLLFGAERLDQTDLWSQDRDLTRNLNPALDRQYTLFPHTSRTSVFLGFNSDLTDHLSLRADAVYQQRDLWGDTITNSAVTTRTNSESQVAQHQMSAGATLKLARGWSADLDLVVAGNRLDNESRNRPISGASAGTLSLTRRENDLWSIDARTSGTLFSVPGGDVRLAAGLGYREEESAGVFSASPNVSADQAISSQYAEIDFPVVGRHQGVPLVYSLRATAAVRRDDYSDFGSNISPRYALDWRPVADLSVSASYSESFRPPSPSYTTQRYYVWGYPVPDGTPSGFSNVLYLGGGPAEGLEPETSENLTVNLDYRPTSIPGLQLGLQYYAFDYVNRITNPDPVFMLLTDLRVAPPELFTRTTLSQAEFDRIIAGAQQVTYFAGGPSPSNFTVVADGRIRNASVNEISGWLATAAYSWDLPGGRLSLSGSANHMEAFRTSLLASSPLIEQVDTVFYPPSWRGRANAVWSAGAWAVSGAWNYTGDYEDNRPLAVERRIDSWSTFDLSVEYDFGQHANGLLSGTRFILSGTNVFDTDPPEIWNGSAGLYNQRYDSANASIIGRFIRAELVKAW